MAITPWKATITNVTNGTDVSAQVINPILAQHTQREQHLYDRLQEIENKSVIIAYDQPILTYPDPNSNPKKYSVVYYHQDTIDSVVEEGISLAKVEFLVTTANNSSYTAANSCYSVGIVSEILGSTANVYLMGIVELDNDIDHATDGLMQSTELEVDDFTPGPLYLSRLEAGKLTRNPGGVAVYVGYAFNRRTILLAPNVSEFNQFFTNYRYNILDRCAGVPEFNGTNWVVADPDLTKVGWIGVDDLPSSYDDLVPDDAKFFYNLPPQDEILVDTGLSEEDRAEQVELAKSLPPFPPNMTFLTVNGVVQSSRDHSDDGIFIVNEVGLWWFDDTEGLQPWAEDTVTEVNVTFDDVTEEVNYTSHPFEVDDRIAFITDDTLPSSLTPGTEYKVATVSANAFTITTIGDTPLTFDTAGTGTHSIPQPYIWKVQKGTSEFRPRMLLQFVKFNPSLKEAVVTSIKRYNSGSEAIRFFKSDKTAESTTGAGNLLARLLLKYVDQDDAVSSATAITSLTYNEETGETEVVNAPMVSKVYQGPGMTITEAADEPGAFILSANAATRTGQIHSLEPDGAELKYIGLHSYLNMSLPATLPSSVIGKFILPRDIPTSKLTFTVLFIGLTSLSSGASNKQVDFEFSYAISKDGSLMSVTPAATSTVSLSVPTPYTAKTVFKAGNTGVIITGLEIPASSIAGGDMAVNFKLERTLPASASYAGDIGIVDIFWKIG